MAEEIDRRLSEIYFNIENPASFSGFSKFYPAVKHLGFSKQEVKEWLERQEIYTLYNTVNRNTVRPKVIVKDKFQQFDMDTVNMVRYSHEVKNKGYCYILIVIDIFTRFLFVHPLQTLTGKEMVKALEQVFSKATPVCCRSDNGVEFKNEFVRKFMEDNGVVHFFSSNETKACYSERVIKSLKTIITRYLNHNETDGWFNVLDLAVESYNNRVHRSIRMTPVEALSSDSYTLWKNQYFYNVKRKYTRRPVPKTFYKFNVNDKVRVSLQRKTFHRQYDKNWSDEIYIITFRTAFQEIPVYELKDLLNRKIRGRFYENELQKVTADSSTVYKIEKIIKKKKLNKKPGYIVRWVGWSTDFDSWVAEDDVKDIDIA